VRHAGRAEDDGQPDPADDVAQDGPGRDAEPIQTAERVRAGGPGGEHENGVEHAVEEPSAREEGAEQYAGAHVDPAEQPGHEGRPRAGRPGAALDDQAVERRHGLVLGSTRPAGQVTDVAHAGMSPFSWPPSRPRGRPGTGRRMTGPSPSRPFFDALIAFVHRPFG
jgi:hypothetical protein